MPQEKIIIKFKPDGHTDLIRALNNLAKAQKKVENVSASHARAIKGTTVATQKFSTIAAGLTTKIKAQGLSWKKLGVETNLVKKAYKGNQLAIEKLRVAMKRGHNGSRLLHNSFATLRAQLLLASFAMSMGIRQLASFVKEASKVEAMGRAFNTLSGGTSNATVAMKQLQEATNGTMSRFDLFQQANNAMILGVSKNSTEMAEMFDIAQRLGQALGRDTRSSVESLITGIGRQSRLMLDNIGIIVKAEEAYESYAEELGVMAESLTDTQKKQAFLNATMVSAREKVARLGEKIIDTQQRMERLGASWKDAKVNLGDLAVLFFNLDENMSILADTADNYNTILDNNVKKNKDANNVLQGALQTVINLNPKLKIMAEVLGFNAREFKLLTEEAEKFISTFTGEIGETFVDIGETVGVVNDSFTATLRIFEAIRKHNESEEGGLATNAIYGKIKPQEFLDSIISVNTALDGMSKAVQTPSMRFEKFTSSADEALKVMSQFSSSMGSAILNAHGFENALAAMAEAFKKTLASMAAQMAARAALFSLFAPFFGFDMSLGQIGKFALTGGVAHKGGLIKDDGKVQRFAGGGTIRGGDNVPILAQGGEFVMQRSAVESIGIENLNRMNQGGGGAITVNVSGNVLSQDFVEGELAENIKEAIRRGTDFGIS